MNEVTQTTNRTVEIKYTFDYWEDAEEIRMLLGYKDAFSNLFDIYNLCRSELKHGDEELSHHINRLLEEIKDLARISQS